MAQNENVLKNFECLLCLQIAEEPYLTTCCDKLLCKLCLDRYQNQNCPRCGRVFQTKVADTFIQRIIDDQSTKCPECLKVMTMLGLKTHKHKCQLLQQNVVYKNEIKQLKKANKIYKERNIELENELKAIFPKQFDKISLKLKKMPKRFQKKMTKGQKQIIFENEKPRDGNHQGWKMIQLKNSYYIYNGLIKNKKANGKGVAINKWGGFYRHEGYFKDGKRNGVGTYMEDNQRRMKSWQGTWLDDKKEGVFVYTVKNKNAETEKKELKLYKYGNQLL